MTSPFPVNAYLVFQVPTSPLSIDELGNAIASTEPLEVQCYFKATPAGSGQKDPAGSSDNRVNLSGRIISPDALPASVIPGARASITLVDPAGVAADQEGDFFLEGVVPSAFGLSSALGAPIRGYFIARSRFGEAV